MMKNVKTSFSKGRISKTVMNDLPSVPISDFENTLSFPSEETSLGRGGFPHISPREMYHAHPALLTVFSTTQLGHSISHCDSCHPWFGNAPFWL